jgi:hypothetical protein
MIPIAASALVVAASAQIALRGGEPTPAGEIVSVDAGGVWLGAAPGTPAAPGQAAPEGQAAGAARAGAPAAKAPALAISWDRIRSLEGADAAAAFMPVALDAWRARSRLERGDFIAAEPLFEALFARYRSLPGPTGAVVAEGLLRCRLHRGAHVKAISPWLTLLEASGPQPAPVLHAQWASEAGLASVLDAQLGLAPALPPIWLSLPSLGEITRSDVVLGAGIRPGEKPTALQSRIQTLAEIYHQAARFEAGEPASLPDPATNDAGVLLAWQIVQARIGDATQREAARRSLADRLKPSASANAPQAPGWVEAWCHAGIGRSLLREESQEQQRLGVVQLLNLPARYGRVHPYLAGLALAETSAALRNLGDAAGADVLAAELFRDYPSHPALEWAPLRSYVPKAEPPPKPAAAPASSPSIPPAPESPGR